MSESALARSALAAVLLLAAIRADADTWGFDYVAEADTLVFGGSRYYAYVGRRSVEDVRTLHKEVFGTGEREVLYRADGNALTDISAAPRGTLVAFFDRYVEGSESVLTIVDLNGAVLERLPRARRFAWSPDGRRIAYLTGEYREDGGWGFFPDGAWIYEIDTRQSERVYSGGYDLEWAGWDGGIYILDLDQAAGDWRVVRLDPVVREPVATSHRGIYFSPDGRHYYNPGREGSELEIFQTADDAGLPVDTALPSPRLVRHASSPRGWLDERTLALASPVPGDTGDYVYDIHTRTMRHASGWVLSVQRSDDRILAIEGDSVVERARDSFATVSRDVE